MMERKIRSLTQAAPSEYIRHCFRSGELLQAVLTDGSARHTFSVRQLFFLFRFQFCQCCDVICWHIIAQHVWKLSSLAAPEHVITRVFGISIRNNQMSRAGRTFSIFSTAHSLPCRNQTMKMNEMLILHCSPQISPFFSPKQ